MRNYEPKVYNDYNEIARARCHNETYGTPLQYAHGTDADARMQFRKWALLWSVGLLISIAIIFAEGL